MIPRLSIVSICFNNPEDLLKTIISVDKQTQKPFEHLIIDGSTNSAIKELSKEYAQPYRKFYHQKDQGISDAFNIGIEKSTGDIIHLLHAGDEYYSTQAIETILKTYQQNPEISWTHSQYVQHRGGIDVVTGAKFNPKQLYKGMTTVGHLTMTVKKKVYEEVGKFDLNKKVAMDYDLLVRLANLPFGFIAEPLVYFAPGGVSNTKVWLGHKEVIDSYEKRYGFSLVCRIWAIRTYILHRFTQTYLGKLLFNLKNRNKQA